MKRLLTIIIAFYCLAAKGQTEKQCPPGYEWMPSLDHTGMQIIADTCLPDSVCKKLWEMWGEYTCLCSGFAIIGRRLRYSKGGEWNDSTGCKPYERWVKIVGNKQINISKKEYEKLEKLWRRKNERPF